MGSLVELKKEIEEVQSELLGLANEVFEYQEILERKTDTLELGQNHLRKLKFALSVLEGENLPRDLGESPQPPPSAEPVKGPSVPRPVDLAPLCEGCGKGRMRPAVTRAPSGVYINMLRCDDGACNNEVY